MAIAPSQFERVAEAVTEKTADLLSAQVAVVDERGIVIASSEHRLTGLSFEPSPDDTAGERLEIPLQLAGRQGRVIVSRWGGGEVVPPHLARVLVELVINQAAVVDRLPNKIELKNTLIHDLLHGEFGDEARLMREAQILGMDLAPPRAVILIDAAAYILGPDGGGRVEAADPRVARRAQLVIGSIVDFFMLPYDTICAYIGNGEVAVLKASNKQNLSRWIDDSDPADTRGAFNPSWANLQALKRAGAALLTHLRNNTRASITISIGRHHRGIDGFARSYADARVALSLGCRFHGSNQVHCLDGLGIPAFVGVADERTKIELATYLLSPLDGEPELLKTLSTFFASDFSPSITARELSIHRNTLSYRLDKIASLTGLDPRHFDDAVQIRLALVLRSLDHDAESAQVRSPDEPEGETIEIVTERTARPDRRTADAS